MLKDPLSLALIGLFLLLIGFCAGWTVKTTPEPDVRVRGLLKAPFVEVMVNGKAVDLSKIRLVPENDGKKKKSGDVGEVGEVGEVVRPAAKTMGCLFCVDGCRCSPCHCNEVVAIATAPSQFEQQQRNGGKSVEAFGIETLAAALKELKEAFFGDKSKGTPGLRDDISKGLGDFYGTLRTGVIVAGGTLCGFLIWVGINVQRIADNTAAKTA